MNKKPFLLLVGVLMFLLVVQSALAGTEAAGATGGGECSTRGSEYIIYDDMEGGGNPSDHNPAWNDGGDADGLESYTTEGAIYTTSLKAHTTSAAAWILGIENTTHITNVGVGIEFDVRMMNNTIAPKLMFATAFDGGGDRLLDRSAGNFQYYCPNAEDTGILGGDFNITVKVVFNESDKYTLYINDTFIAHCGDASGNYVLSALDAFQLNFGNADQAMMIVDRFKMYNLTIGSDNNCPAEVAPAADIENPAFSNAANETSISRFQNITMNITITDDTALADYTLEWNDTGTVTNFTTISTSGTSQAVSTSANITALANQIVQWRYYACDTSNNCNVSATYSFTVAETSLTFSNAVNDTVVYSHQNLTMNITITAIGGVDGYIFSTNLSGIWINDSFVDTAEASPFSASTSKNVTNRPTEETIGWRYYANSTAGENWNQSSIFTFEIANDKAKFSNAVNNAAVYSHQNQTMNITISADNTLVDGYIFSTNLSGSWVNDSFVDIANNASHAAFTSKNVTNIPTAETIGWRYYANTTGHNSWNQSGIFTFEIINDKAKFSNAANNSIVYPNRNQTMNITISADNTLVDGYIFSTNLSGSWVNDSFVDIANNASHAAFTSKNVSGFQSAKTIGWRYYANTTGHNSWNQSDIFTFEITALPTFLILAKDLFNSTSIQEFEIIFVNATHTIHANTTNGEVDTNQTAGNINVSIWSGVYINRTFSDIVVGDTLITNNITLEIYQAILNITAQTKVNGTTILSFSTTIAQFSNSTTLGSIRYFPNAQIHQINVTSTGYQQLQHNETVSPLDNRTISLELFTNNLTIEVRKRNDNSLITDYDANLSHATFDYSETKSAGGANNITFDIINEDYNLLIDATGFAPTTFSITVNTSSQAFTAYLNDENKFNISFHDEITRELLDGFLIEAEFIVEDQESRVFNTTNGTLLVDINFPEFEHLIRYTDKNNTYSERFHYITPVNRSFNSLKLFLVDLSNDTNVDAEVLDEANDPVEDVIVKVLRYDVITNQHVLSEIKKTDFEGKARLRLVLDEEFYKFILEKDGEIKLETDPALIRDTTIVFRITLVSKLLEVYKKSQDINYAISFDSSNNSYRYFWSDSSNEIEQTCLTLVRFNASNVNDDQVCSTASTGVMYLSPTNITGATYKADITATIDSKRVYIDSLIVSYGGTLLLGKTGWYLTGLLIILVSLGLGAISPTLMLLLTPSILLLTKFISLHDIGYGVIIAIYVVAIAIAYIISNRS